MSRIIVISSSKGGVGKSTLAYELAYLMDAVLVDLEYTHGGVTEKWGWRHEERVSSPLVSAIKNNRVPRAMKAAGRPWLVPSSQDRNLLNFSKAQVGGWLKMCSKAWGKDIIVDTSNALFESIYGAFEAADVVLVPTIIRTAEIAALVRHVRDLRDYPVIIVPNLVPTRKFQWKLVKEIQKLERETGCYVGSIVPEIPTISSRLLRTAVSSTGSRKYSDFVKGLNKNIELINKVTTKKEG